MSILPARSASRRRRITTEAAIKAFFGSNALVASVVLALITIFLFREGFGFFGENLKNLRLYRRAGLEYFDLIPPQAATHSALSRQINQFRLHANCAETDHPTLVVFCQ